MSEYKSFQNYWAIIEGGAREVIVVKPVKGGYLIYPVGSSRPSVIAMLFYSKAEAERAIRNDINSPF